MAAVPPVVTVLRASQVIHRPPRDVFQTLIHVEEFPRWNGASNPSARKVSDGPIGKGTRFEMEVKGFGMVPQTLEEFEPEKRVRIVPDLRMLKGGHRFILTPEGAGTRVDHELEMAPQGIYKLMGPMMRMTGRKNLRMLVENLQAHLEKP